MATKGAGDVGPFHPGGILACDLATVVGWAYAAGNDTPLYGSARMGKHGATRGESFVAFDLWLNTRIDEFRPSVLVWESPIFYGRGGMATAQKLMGLAAIAELIGSRRGVKCYEVESSTVVKSFVGRGGRFPGGRAEKKAAVLAACRLRGWSPIDDNAGDALAIVDFAQSLLGRGEVNRAAGPLFR